MLEIDNLTVAIQENEEQVLKHLSLTIKPGKVHAIMGPNGVGKSTLSKVIMGHPDYQVLEGSIRYQGQDITSLATDERARLGIFLLMQDPAVIEGVTNSECIRTALNERSDKPVNLYQFIKQMNEKMDSLHMDKTMMHRFVNQGFSGGEKKKNEVLQLSMLEPDFIILDELDSGLDVDSLKLVCQKLQDYKQEHPNCSMLIITHYARVLDLLKPDYVHQMMEGAIVKTGDITLAYDIEKTGYHGINEIRKMMTDE